MSARWWTFGLWALVAGSALYWALQLFVIAPAAPPGTVAVMPGAGARGDLARLFGADAPPPVAAAAAPVADNRFALVGVLSPRGALGAKEGVALIAIDGAPAKAYRVGATVKDETVLQSVRSRGATLGPRGGAATASLELTPPPMPATGTLQAAVSGAGTPMQPPRGVGTPQPLPPGSPPPEQQPPQQQLQ
jgi:general secretion pathway protein C